MAVEYLASVLSALVTTIVVGNMQTIIIANTNANDNILFIVTSHLNTFDRFILLLCYVFVNENAVFYCS